MLYSGPPRAERYKELRAKMGTYFDSRTTREVFESIDYTNRKPPKHPPAVRKRARKCKDGAYRI